MNLKLQLSGNEIQQYDCKSDAITGLKHRPTEMGMRFPGSVKERRRNHESLEGSATGK
jgi:hypothetical protein